MGRQGLRPCRRSAGAGTISQTLDPVDGQSDRPISAGRNRESAACLRRFGGSIPPCYPAPGWATFQSTRPPKLPESVLSHLSLAEQSQLQAKAAQLAKVFQRSSSNVEGRNGSLSLRNHQLRGLDHPRKRACLTAVHNFFLTRPDGTTAAERFFGQKPRSMFAAILGAVEIPPAPISPPQRALG